MLQRQSFGTIGGIGLWSVVVSLPAIEAMAEATRIAELHATAIEDRAEEFAQSISAESAKPIATARVEAARCVDTFRFSAAVARFGCRS